MVFLGLPFRFVSDGFRKGVLPLFFLLGLFSFAHAHPLGALSLNRYGIIDLYPQKIGIQLILDFAEVPSYRELEKLDANNDRLVSPKEMADYKRTVTRRYVASFTLFDGEGNPLDVEIQETQLTLLQGEAGLACIRILWKGSVFWEPNAFSSISLQFTDRGIPEIKGERKQFICLHPGMAIRESQNANFEQWKLMDAPMDAYQAEGAAALFSFKPAERAGEEELFGFTLPKSLLSPEELLQVQIEPNKAGDYPISKATLGPLDGIREKLALFQPKIPANETPINEIASQKHEWTEFIHQDDLSWSFALFAFLLAAFFGAMHALAPGHGKTIVAAYLVGTKGTVRHAVFLGLLVTFTHVFSVFVLGVITLFATRGIVSPSLYAQLEFFSGGLIVLIGCSLLRNRWKASRHDHSHSHGYAHPHGHAHSHGHTHTHEIPGDLSFKNLIALGVSGGLVPCPEAIVVLLAAIANQRIVFGLSMIFFFSFGLAAVLILIGILVVTAKNRIRLFEASGTWPRILPWVSPILVTLIGGIIITKSIWAGH